MDRVARHYEQLLARHYSWMIGMTFQAKVFSMLEAARDIVNRVLDASSASPRLVCHNSGGLAYFLPHSYKAKLVGRPHVEEVAGWSYFGGVYRSPSDQITTFASDNTALDRLFPDWGITPAMTRQFAQIRTAAIASPDLMRKFGWHIGQTVMLRSTITALYQHTLSFTIVGELGARGPGQLFIFRDDYLDEVEGHSPVSYFWIRLDKLASAPAVIADIDDSFHNSGSQTQTETERSYAASLLSSYRALIAVFEAISVIILITMLLVAANTAAMSIRERRREIALMRALGFDSTRVLAALLSECWIVGMLGGVVGAGAAFAMLRIAPIVFPNADVRVQMSGFVIVLSLAIASAIGLVSGIGPGYSAVRGRITQVLRTP